MIEDGVEMQNSMDAPPTTNNDVALTISPPEVNVEVAVHSHELQAALLIVDSSAFPSHQVKMVSQEDLKKVLADIE